MKQLKEFPQFSIDERGVVFDHKQCVVPLRTRVRNGSTFTYLRFSMHGLRYEKAIPKLLEETYPPPKGYKLCQNRLHDGNRLVRECDLYGKTMCVKCKNKYEKIARDEGRYFFYTMLKCARSSKYRCDLPEIYFETLFTIQKGLCYYTGMEMCTKPGQWQCSKERLDRSKGYVHGNVVLCCWEMNSSAGWGKEKLRRFAGLYGEQSSEPIPDNLNVERKKRVFVTTIEDKWRCGHCKEMRLESDWYVTVGGPCKHCMLLKRNTVQDKLRRLVTACYASHKRQSYPGEVTLTLGDVNDLWINQKGCCAYSGIPMMTVANGDWRVSLERINPGISYTSDNCCLVCWEFNTPRQASWSREKVQKMVHTYKKSITDAGILKTWDEIDVFLQKPYLPKE